MTLSITRNEYEPGKDYLLIGYDGIVSIDTIIEYAPRILQKLQNDKIFRLVEDYRKVTFDMNSEQINDMQKRQMTVLIESGIAFTKIKRAIVVGENYARMDIIGFFENLNMNRGVQIQVFADMYKAIRWVVSD